jgi:hypothetical protein
MQAKVALVNPSVAFDEEDPESGYLVWSQSPESKIVLPGWQNPGRVFGLSTAALVKVFLNVVQHRQDKAQSARSEAVLALGAQVLGTLRTVV